MRRAIAVIGALAERGMAFRGTNLIFGSLHNGNYLGLLELISRFDAFLQRILRNKEMLEKETSYLSKTICEELIEVMAKKVHVLIVDEQPSGYLSL